MAALPQRRTNLEDPPGSDGFAAAERRASRSHAPSGARTAVANKRPAAARRSGPPADEVETAIVDVAKANQTDGHRMVTALVARKRVLRVMRKRRLVRRRLDRRRRPVFFR